MASLREEINAEFERLEEDLLYTEKALFAASEHYRLLHYTLGASAAIASAITAVSAMNDYPALSIGLSVIAAVAAALLTFLKPEATATHNVDAARQLADLRSKIRQVRVLDAHNESPITTSDLRNRAAAFTAEKQLLLSDAPTTGPLSYRRGARKINKGDFGYAADARSSGTEVGA